MSDIVDDPLSLANVLDREREVGGILEPIPIPVEDPFAPDAPIYHLLSVKHNPLVKDLSTEQLQALVQRMRTLATSAPTMTSKLQAESGKRRAKKPTLEEQLAKKGLSLDDI